MGIGQVIENIFFLFSRQILSDSILLHQLPVYHKALFSPSNQDGVPTWPPIAQLNGRSLCSPCSTIVSNDMYAVVNRARSIGPHENQDGIRALFLKIRALVFHLTKRGAQSCQYQCCLISYQILPEPFYGEIFQWPDRRTQQISFDPLGYPHIVSELLRDHFLIRTGLYALDQFL